jgi:hypothetical protein
VSVIRHKIAKYLTDRPGQMVTKDAIMEDGGWDARQVTAAILTLQQESPIGPEIETIVKGNMWRYLPKVPIPTRSSTADGGQRNRPLTALLYEYLTSHPGVVVYVDTLVEYTGRTPEQIKVGVNNMLQNRPHMKPLVDKVIQGQAWRYTPDGRVNSRRPSQRPTVPVNVPVPSTVTSASTTAEPATSNDDIRTSTSPRMFEEVGELPDGDLVIRDDDGIMYRAVISKLV